MSYYSAPGGGGWFDVWEVLGLMRAFCRSEKGGMCTLCILHVLYK